VTLTNIFACVFNTVLIFCDNHKYICPVTLHITCQLPAQFCNFPQYVYKVTKTTDFFVTYFPSVIDRENERLINSALTIYILEWNCIDFTKVFHDFTSVQLVELICIIFVKRKHYSTFWIGQDLVRLTHETHSLAIVLDVNLEWSTVDFDLWIRHLITDEYRFLPVS